MNAAKRTAEEADRAAQEASAAAHAALARVDEARTSACGRTPRPCCPQRFTSPTAWCP